MVVTISVTEADIASGERQSCETCPIAHAIRRAVPGTSVGVNRASVVFGDRYRWTLTDESGHRRLVVQEVPLPPEARHFVRLFDDAQKVAPFAFDLDVPPDESIHSQTSAEVGCALSDGVSDPGGVKGGVS